VATFNPSPTHPFIPPKMKGGYNKQPPVEPSSKLRAIRSANRNPMKLQQQALVEPSTQLQPIRSSPRNERRLQILSNLVQSCVFLSNPVQSCPILSNPVFSCPILYNPVLSYPILCFLVKS